MFRNKKFFPLFAHVRTSYQEFPSGMSITWSLFHPFRDVNWTSCLGPSPTGVTRRVVPRFSGLCSCCCLPQLACSILATWVKYFVGPCTRYAAGRQHQQRDVADIHSFVRFVLNHGSQSHRKKDVHLRVDGRSFRLRDFSMHAGTN